MKYIITESQYKLLSEEKILKLDFDVFNNDWDILQRFLNKKGNPPYKLIGDLDLRGVDVVTLGSLVGVEGYLYLSGSNIKSLGNLKSVGDNLYLNNTKIESLGNLVSVEGDFSLNSSKVKSLGDLEYVGGYLNLYGSKIKSLGNLQSVGGNLYLTNIPLSKTTTEEEIRNIPNLTIGGNIYI